MNLLDIKENWKDLAEIIVVLVLLKYEVFRIRSTVNKLKKDADNFGEILGTPTALARKKTKTKEAA